MAFPSAVPSSRSFTDGFFRIARSQFRLGGSTRKAYGQNLQEIRLSLEFQNVDDAIAKQFVDEYNASQGNLQAVELPDALLAGIGAYKTQITSVSGQWFIENPMIVESVFPNVSTVRLELIKEVNDSVVTVFRPDSSNEVLFGNEIEAWRLRVYGVGRAVEKRPTDTWFLTDMIGISIERGSLDVWIVDQYLQSDILEAGGYLFPTGELLTGEKV